MLSLKTPDDGRTSDPVEMAGDIYTDLYAAERVNPQGMEDILHHLPQISPQQRERLDSNITFQEVTVAVQQLSTGRAPGIDDAPADFYNTFWGLIQKYFSEVLQEWTGVGFLSQSCRR